MYSPQSAQVAQEIEAEMLRPREPVLSADLLATGQLVLTASYVIEFGQTNIWVAHLPSIVNYKHELRPSCYLEVTDHRPRYGVLLPINDPDVVQLLWTLDQRMARFRAAQQARS